MKQKVAELLYDEGNQMWSDTVMSVQEMSISEEPHIAAYGKLLLETLEPTQIWAGETVNRYGSDVALAAICEFMTSILANMVALCVRAEYHNEAVTEIAKILKDAVSHHLNNNETLVYVEPLRSYDEKA